MHFVRNGIIGSEFAVEKNEDKGVVQILCLGIVV